MTVLLHSVGAWRETQNVHSREFANDVRTAGEWLRQDNRFEESAEHLREAIRIYDHLKLLDHPYFSTWGMLGHALLRSENLVEAEKALVKAWDGFRQHPSPSAGDAEGVARSFQSLYQKLGKPEEEAKWEAELKALIAKRS